MRKFLRFLLPASILGIFLLLSFFSAFQESLTFDEVVTIREGKNAWLHQTYDIELYHPPLAKVLQTAPLIFLENGLHIQLSSINEKNISRSVVIIMGALLLLSVYLTTKKYFGYWQGIVALTLLAFEPNTLAFSHIVNTDMVVNLLIFLCYVLLLSLLLKPTRRKAILFAVCVGLGLSSKMSFDSFFTLSALILIIFIKKKQTVAFLWNKKFYFIFLTIIALLVVWSTYFFHWNVIVKERKDENRFSEKLLKSAQQHHNTVLVTIITIAKTQKFPLGDYIALYKNVALAKASPACFFLGTFYPKCYWYFMPVTFLLKTPLPFIVWLFAGIYTIQVVKKKKKLFLYFSIPFVVIFIHAALSGAFPLNRYMLPLYPFAAIIGSHTIYLWRHKWVRIGATVLLLWYCITVLTAYPHYLSYTNEIAGPRQIQYRNFWDANLDWGQSLPDMVTYSKKNTIGLLHFSYFGQDNGDVYGLKSDLPYGSPRKPDICAFHTIPISSSAKEVTVISISNWYLCGYHKQAQYIRPKDVISDSFLLF